MVMLVPRAVSMLEVCVLQARLALVERAAEGRAAHSRRGHVATGRRLSEATILHLIKTLEPRYHLQGSKYF